MSPGASRRYIVHGSKQLGPTEKPTEGASVALPFVVAQWPRNEREVIRITLSKYRGRISIDIRVWFLVEGGESRPSRRGISLRLTEISDIRKALRKAHKTAVELGFFEQKTDL